MPSRLIGLLFLAAAVLPLARAPAAADADLRERLSAIHGDAIALEAAWYRFLAEVPGADDDALLRLELGGGLLDKPVEVEVLRRGGIWLPGRAWTPALNHAVHEVSLRRWQVDGPDCEGVLAITFVRGGGWVEDMVAEMKLRDHERFTVRYRIRGRIDDGTIDAHYEGAFPPLPEDDAARAAALKRRPERPFPKGGGACSGSLADLELPLEPRHARPPASWESASTRQRYDAARYLEVRATRRYRAIRATALAAGSDVAYPAALHATALWTPQRPVLAPPDAADDDGGSPVRETGSDGGDGLGLGDLGDALDNLAEDQELAPEEIAEARATMARIADRVARIKRLVATREAAGDPGTVQRDGATYDDPDFGPWYGEATLSEEDGINVLPADLGAEGTQRWPAVGAWEILGPFPLTRFDLDTPLLPELVADGAIRYRVERGRLKRGADYKAATEIDWQGTRPARVFGYVAPPNWSKANRVYQRCPPALTGRHTGIEDSTTFARARLRSPAATTAIVGLGLNRRGKLWLDDRLVWAGPLEPDPRAAEQVVLLELPLEKGVNELVLRIDVGHASPAWWMRVCTRGAPRDATAVAAAKERIAVKLAAADVRRGSGWRGDGSAHFAGEPPLAWDYGAGHNVAWRTPLRYWSNASPALAEDRLFVAIEPHFLVCLDKGTGEKRWERRVSAIDFLPDAEKAEAEHLFDAWWAARAARDAVPRSVARPKKWIQASYGWWDEEGGGEPVDERADASPELLALLERRDQLRSAPDPAAVQDELAKVEEEIDALRAVEAGVAELDRALKQAERSFVEYLAERSHVSGLDGYWYDYDGYAFATPVTDGEHVWWKNGMGAVACFDLEGNRVWARRTHAGGSGSPTIPSPLLIDGVLVLKLPHHPEKGRSKRFVLVGLDAASGDERWRTPPLRNSGWNASTPQAVTCSDGESIMTVIACGGGSLVRADDGHVLAADIGTESADASPYAMGEVVFFPRPTLTAVRLVMKDRDTVGFRRLWSHGNGSHGVDYGGVFGADGILYHPAGFRLRKGPGEAPRGLRAIDAASGEVVAQIPLMRKGGNYWSLSSAGEKTLRVVGGDGKFSSAHPKPPMDCTVVTRGRDPLVLARNVIERTYGGPAIDGARMYLRGYRGVTCIAYTGDAGRRYEARQVARTLLDDLAAAPPAEAAAIELAGRPGHGEKDGVRWQLNPGWGPPAWRFCGPFPAAGADEALASFGGPGTQDAEATASGGGVTRAWGHFAQEYLHAKGLDRTIERRNFSLILHHRRRFAVGAATGGEPGTVVFLAAEVQVDTPRTVTVEAGHPGAKIFVHDREVAPGLSLRLGEGWHPLLVQVPVAGRETTVAPCFHDAGDGAAERWERRRERIRPWLERVIALAPESPEAARARVVLDR